MIGRKRLLRKAVVVLAVMLSSTTLTGCHELYCAFVEGLTGEPLDCSHDAFPDLGIELPPLPPPPSLPTTTTRPPTTTTTTVPSTTTTSMTTSTSSTTSTSTTSTSTSSTSTSTSTSTTSPGVGPSTTLPGEVADRLRQERTSVDRARPDVRLR